MSELKVVDYNNENVTVADENNNFIQIENKKIAKAILNEILSGYEQEKDN